VFRHRSGRESDLPRRCVREKPHPARSRAGDAGNSTLSAAFRHFRALFEPERRPRERAACISRPIARSIHAARNRLLSNTHGSVDFPRSPSRLASLVTLPWEGGKRSVAPPVTHPRRTPGGPRHSPHPPAVSATATASQGRGRDGRSRRPASRPLSVPFHPQPPPTPPAESTVQGSTPPQRRRGGVFSINERWSTVAGAPGLRSLIVKPAFREPLAANS